MEVRILQLKEEMLPVIKVYSFDELIGEIPNIKEIEA